MGVSFEQRPRSKQGSSGLWGGGGQAGPLSWALQFSALCGEAEPGHPSTGLGSGLGFRRAACWAGGLTSHGLNRAHEHLQGGCLDSCACLHVCVVCAHLLGFILSSEGPPGARGIPHLPAPCLHIPLARCGQSHSFGAPHPLPRHIFHIVSLTI